MIVREILANPEIADNFDHFNDYSDTKRFLEGCIRFPFRNHTAEEVRAVIARLDATHAQWEEQRRKEMEEWLAKQAKRNIVEKWKDQRQSLRSRIDR